MSDKQLVMSIAAYIVTKMDETGVSGGSRMSIGAAVLVDGILMQAHGEFDHAHQNAVKLKRLLDAMAEATTVEEMIRATIAHADDFAVVKMVPTPDAQVTH